MVCHEVNFLGQAVGSSSITYSVLDSLIQELKVV